jgi:glutamine synthetase
MEAFIKEHRITEVECLVPDLSGIARGKILPADKFLRILRDRGLRIPESIFCQTVTGEFPEEEDVTNEESGDVYLTPDPNTIRIVPWYQEPTASIIADCFYADGSPVDIASRFVLRHVLDLYAQQGWKPILAPELEFYLVQINTDADYPLLPPVGRSGRTESGRQAYGIDAVNEFDPIFEDVYDFCEAQNIDVDTLTHESGAAQIEINFNHGDALDLADQVFLFKRTVRETAIRHKVYATFMAKPMQNEPGSAMHIHQSVVGIDSGKNVFANDDGTDTDLFRAHVAGLQKYLPLAMPLYAPNVNSFRRLVPNTDAPINVHWARDNRTVGLRVPVSGPDGRRVENRLPGADANPYLAMAASLACGYLGMIQHLQPEDPIRGSAHGRPYQLPRHHFEAMEKFLACEPLRGILGAKFCSALMHVKQHEHEAYQRVISSWERENLLLNV